jgi:hypothetical protein
MARLRKIEKQLYRNREQEILELNLEKFISAFEPRIPISLEAEFDRYDNQKTEDFTKLTINFSDGTNYTASYIKSEQLLIHGKSYHIIGMYTSFNCNGPLQEKNYVIEYREDSTIIDLISEIIDSILILDVSLIQNKNPNILENDVHAIVSLNLKNNTYSTNVTTTQYKPKRSKLKSNNQIKNLLN